MAAAAKQQLIQNYIKDLKQFLRERGGSEISSHFAGFHANHKKHRELVPDLKVFCDAHPEHFAVSSPTKGPWTVSLNDKDWKAVLALRNFILTRGGMLQSQDFPDLKQHHPKAAAWIYSGGRSLREFCQIHEEIFIVESSNSSPSVRIRLRPEATRATDRPNADGALTEAEVVADLMQFIKANGGCVTSNMFGAFFSSRPKHRAAAPKLQNFFEKHPQHFHISDECSGPHWTVSLAKSKHQASNADGALTEAEVVADLMQFIEANGGCVTSNKFASFFSSRPKHRAAAPKLRNFFEKHPQHFCISDEGNNQHWTVSLGTDNRAVARKIMSSLYQRLFVDKSHSAQQALKVDGGLTEGQVAADLVNLIQAAGGSMLFNEFTLFFKSRPQHRAAVPRLRQFLERHPELFRILDEGNSAVWKVLLVNCSNGADISGSTDTTPTVSLSPTGTESVKQSTETCVQKLVERRLSEDPWSNGEDPWSNSLVRAELPHLKTNQHTSASKEGKEKQDNRSSTNGSAHEEDPWAGGRDPWSERVLVSSGTVTSSAERREQNPEIPSWPRGSDPAGLPSACLSERMGKENADPWANGQDPWSAHLRSPKSVDSEQVQMVEGTPAAWADWRDPRSRSFPLGQPTAPADMQPASITVQHAAPSAGYSPCTQLPYSAYESGESSNKATAWQSDENCFKRGELRSSPDALPAAPAASAAPAPQPWIYSQASLDETSAHRILQPAPQPSPHGGEGRRYGSEEGKLVERRPGSWAEEAWGQHDLPSKVLETCDKELHQAEEQRCVCELDSLLSKLPEKLFTTMSAPQLGEVLHQAKVQRLVLQRGRPLQAALCSGWLAAHELPGATFTSQDLADVASQLTAAESPWRSGIFRIPGCLHRASFVYRGQELDAVNLHVSRLLPGLSNAIAPQLSSGSLLFLGPATSGKTSSLREAAASLAHTYQVVLLDFHEELPSGDFDRIRSPVPSDSDPVAAVDRAIAEQSPEVIAAEFADVAAALQSAQLCSEAGVRLLCTLRGTVGGLTAAFARSSVPGSGTFPFDTVVVLRRQLDTWHVYAKSGATSSLGSAPSSAAQHSDSCAFLRKPRAVLRLKILGNPEGPSIPESEGRMSATPSVHTLVSEPEEYGQI